MLVRLPHYPWPTHRIGLLDCILVCVWRLQRRSLHFSQFIFRMQCVWCVYVSRWTHVINWSNSFHFILFGPCTLLAIHIINVAVRQMTVRGYRTRVQFHIYLPRALLWLHCLQIACKVTHHGKFFPSFFSGGEKGEDEGLQRGFPSATHKRNLVNEIKKFTNEKTKKSHELVALVYREL